MNKGSIWVGLCMWGYLASGCIGGTCTEMGCLGKPLTVSLVDADGAAVGAKGEVRYEHHQSATFDCSLAPESTDSYAECDKTVLTLEPVYNADDTLELRFERADGTFTDWQEVGLTVQTETKEDFNGPGCDCSYYQGAADPVTVPADAQL